jgi:integrase
VTVWKDEHAKRGQQWKARIVNAAGKREQRSFATKALADGWELEEKKIQQRIEAGIEVRRESVTFRELAELWEKNNPPSSWKRSMLKHSIKRWGDVPVRSIQPDAVGAWLHGLDKSPKTKTHILGVLRQVFESGVEWGYLPRSPARPRAFKAPGTERITPIQPFESWEQVLAVAGRLPLYESAFVRFVCATGLRAPSEVIDARWKDVNLRERLLTVHGTKTENAERTIPLSRHAIDALNDLPRGIGDALIFVGRSGGRFDYPNWRRSWWRDALEAEGLEQRDPYEMRHTFATLALQQGASIDDVSQVLGHSDITITLRYYRKWTRPMLERFRDVLDTINQEDDDVVEHQ